LLLWATFGLKTAPVAAEFVDEITDVDAERFLSISLGRLFEVRTRTTTTPTTTTPTEQELSVR
jgi:hypothetical protein